MKPRLAVLVAAALLPIVAACSSSSSSASSTSTSTPVAQASSASIAGDVVEVIDAVPTPAVKALDVGYQKAATALGLKLVVVQSLGDPTKDLANIDNASSIGAKAILLVPVSAVGDAAALSAAAAKGMCIGVGYANYSPQNPLTTGIKVYFGYNDTTGGTNLTDQVAKKMGGKGGLVYIAGTASDPGSVTRENAIKAELKAKWPGIKFLGAQPSNYDPATARTVMQNFITTYGSEITGVIAAADSLAQPAADVVANSNLKGKVVIGGFGGQGSYVDYIKAGKAYATVPFPFLTDGENAMNAIASCLRGDRSSVLQSSTDDSVLAPLASSGYIVTAENVNAYTPQY